MKPRRHIDTTGASELAASQQRKPEAAQIVDWFYAFLLIRDCYPIPISS
jgi:hypothetical protein